MAASHTHTNTHVQTCTAQNWVTPPVFGFFTLITGSGRAVYADTNVLNLSLNSDHVFLVN